MVPQFMLSSKILDVLSTAKSFYFLMHFQELKNYIIYNFHIK